MKKPIPYDENQDPDPFWKTLYEDPFDRFAKPRGFMTDLLYYLRGTEVPTVYTVWTALSIISAVVRREAWIDWYPSDFYSNLYVVLLGEAGNKKTTMVDIGLELISEYHDYIEDETLRRIKKPNILKNKATPEAILQLMFDNSAGVSIELRDSSGEKIMDENGNPLKYRRGSELVLGLTEMSVMINKQQYTESMVQNLIDLYDCHGTWEWTTKSEGKRILKNLHTTLIAATTPGGFQAGLPPSALSDGFLSRTIVANSTLTAREFARPKKPAGAPTKKDLMRRLAYIASAVQGEYKLTEEADRWYEEWYTGFRKKLMNAGDDIGIVSRQNITVLKVAFLLKAQSYPEFGDKYIGVEYFQYAAQLVNATYVTAMNVINQVKYGGNEFHHVFKVRHYIQERGKVLRKKLLQNTRVKSAELSAIIRYLMDEGSISIWQNGVKQERPSTTTTELYVWEGEGIEAKYFKQVEEQRYGKTGKETDNGKGKSKSHIGGVQRAQVVDGHVKGAGN